MVASNFIHLLCFCITHCELIHLCTIMCTQITLTTLIINHPNILFGVCADAYFVWQCWRHATCYLFHVCAMSWTIFLHSQSFLTLSHHFSISHTPFPQFLHLLLTKILLFRVDVLHLTQPQSFSCYRHRRFRCRSLLSSLKRNMRAKKRPKRLKTYVSKWRTFFGRNIILFAVCNTPHSFLNT